MDYDITAEMYIKNLTDQDRLDVSHGFSRGNYGNAYETEDWEVFRDTIINDEEDRSAYYVIACMLGFFSCYELHEISDYRDAVEHFREIFKRVFPEIAW